MDRRFRAIVAVAIASGGCGEGAARPRLTPDQLLARLRELPNVTAEEAPTEQPDVHYYILHFSQPLDHDQPMLSGRFQQEVSLLHRNEQDPVPMVVHTSGYDDYYLDQPVELTKMLAANQVSIEHRFFGQSCPEGGEWSDWSKLTIEQMAADEHEIIAALKTIYEGAFITTGGSKGGMTAVFHHTFYPEDVDGTVAYVAPISFGTPDPRYPPFLDDIGKRACRESVRALAQLMLSDRRDAMELQAQNQATLQAAHYTRIALGAAVEAAIVGLEWTFWQMFGDSKCMDVPMMTSDGPPLSDEVLFKFLDAISPVTDNNDEAVARFAPYYYQAYAQLGFPDYGAAYLAPYLRYSDADYIGEMPTPHEPTYDDESMRRIVSVAGDGDRLLFIYGEWDPWTAGKFPIGDAHDSKVYTQTRGNHRSNIAGLDMDDREDAFSRLRRWTGVDPQLTRARRVEVDGPTAPRMPPVLVRALRATK
jgi:hypothetical protein